MTNQRVWRFALGGRELHDIETRLGRTSQCGITLTNFSDWRGTATQAEYDKAATLPKCVPCKRGEIR